MSRAVASCCQTTPCSAFREQYKAIIDTLSTEIIGYIIVDMKEPKDKTTPKTEPNVIRPEDMPDFQNALDQAVIKSLRERFPDWTDERIIEELQVW